MKKYLLLFCMLFLLSFKVNALEVNEINFENEKNLSNYVKNPLWETYNSKDRSNSNIIISEYVVEPDDNVIDRYKWTHGAESVYPSSYDLRNVGGINYVTPVKNQDTLGICWSFATISSMETYLLKHNMSNLGNNMVTFNERQLDYATVPSFKHTTFLGTTNFQAFSDVTTNYYMYYSDGYRPLGGGGSFETAAYSLARGFSPVRQETSSTWSHYWTGTVNNEIQMSANDVFDIEDVEYSVTGFDNFVTYYPGINSDAEMESMRNRIKNSIIENGSVYVSTIAPYPGTLGSCVAYYTDNTGNHALINWRGHADVGEYVSECGVDEDMFDYLHAMSIIGWDDNYRISYCANGANLSAPVNGSCNNGTLITVNGVWILKNSWGPEENHLPYVYMSYNSMAVQYGSITGMTLKDFENNYDELSVLKTTNDSGGYYRSFKKSDSGNEVLKRVSIINTATSQSTFYVDVLINGSYRRFGSVQADQPGMVSVVRSDSDFVLDGDSFVIRVTGMNSVIENVYAFTNYNDNITNKVLDMQINEGKLVSENNTTYDTREITISSRNLTTGTNLNYQIRSVTDNAEWDISDFSLVGLSTIISNASKVVVRYNHFDMPYGRYYFIVNDGSTVNVGDWFEVKPELTFRSTSINVEVGQSYDLTYDYVNRSTSTFHFSYSSDNENVAVVDSNGRITGVSEGSTNIKVKILVNNVLFQYPIYVSVSDFGFVGYEIVNDYLYIPSKLNIPNFERNIRYSGDYTFDYQNYDTYLGSGTLFTVYKSGNLFKTYSIIVLGDVNGDGQIKSNDALLIERKIVGIQNISSCGLVAADTSRDGQIKSNDALLIKRYIVNLVNGF